jgi:hypothetical protein
MHADSDQVRAGLVYAAELPQRRIIRIEYPARLEPKVKRAPDQRCILSGGECRTLFQLRTLDRWLS